MKRVGVMASYPARRDTLIHAAASVAAQVDRLTIVLNQYDEVPSQVSQALPDNVRFVLPKTDLKDVGKFSMSVGADDLVFLCDDDILYPDDYCSHLAGAWERYKELRAVIGVHGIIYSDFFDGDPRSRLVHLFTGALEADAFVNQLGTGTVVCAGYQMPPLKWMRSSAGFVDLRFAVHAERNGYPRICIGRGAEWMRQLETKTSLFETVTAQWPPNVTAEAQEIAGFRFLPLGAPDALACRRGSETQT